MNNNLAYAHVVVPPLIKKEVVLEICAMSKSTLYRLVKAGEFPEPVSLGGGRSVAWRADEVAHWIENRPRVCLARSEKKGGAA